MGNKNCFHCGKEYTAKEEIQFDEKSFCCVGCKTVYEIFSQNDLTCYYDFQSAPGATPQEIKMMKKFNPNYWNFKKIQFILFPYTYHIFTVVHVFGFWRIYKNFKRE
jgi:hypothetical protein